MDLRDLDFRKIIIENYHASPSKAIYLGRINNGDFLQLKSAMEGFSDERKYQVLILLSGKTASGQISEWTDIYGIEKTVEEKRKN